MKQARLAFFKLHCQLKPCGQLQSKGCWTRITRIGRIHTDKAKTKDQ